MNDPRHIKLLRTASSHETCLEFCTLNSMLKLCWQLLARHLRAGCRLAAWLCSERCSVGPPCLCLHKITALQIQPALKKTQTLFVCLRPWMSSHNSAPRLIHTSIIYQSERDGGGLGFISVSISASLWGDEVKNSTYFIRRHDDGSKREKRER